MEGFNTSDQDTEEMQIDELNSDDSSISNKIINIETLIIYKKKLFQIICTGFIL